MRNCMHHLVVNALRTCNDAAGITGEATIAPVRSFRLSLAVEGEPLLCADMQSIALILE
jgi:hypothetical protein